MVKYISYIISFFLLSLEVDAQMNPQYSHFMYGQSVINPSHSGSKDGICATMIRRDQWMGFEGAPVTMLLNLDASINPLGIKSGVGLNIINDQIGFQQNFYISANYAYRMSIRNGTLAIGLNAGLMNFSLDGANWSAPDGHESDPLIPKGNFNKIALDLGGGLFYSTEKWYVGASAMHLNRPHFNIDSIPNLRPTYYFNAGYSLQLNPVFEIVPATHLKFDGTVIQYDLNALLIYNKKIWGGVSYRAGSLVGLIGLELISGLKIGYAYELSTSRLAKFGTQEIMINYCFDIILDKKPQQYKSIRY